MSTLSSGVVSFGVSCTETFSASELPAAETPAVSHNQFNRTLPTLSPTTTPKINAAVVMKVTLVAGSFTLDLTAAPNRLGGTQDLTGYKIVAFLCNNRAGGNHAVTIGGAASNPFEPFGAGVSPVLVADGSKQEYFGVNGAAVGAGAKNLKFTGTSTEQFELEMLFAAP